MNPLLPIAAGIGLIFVGIKQLSGQSENKSGDSLTDSKNRAKVTSASSEKSETETKTETNKETANNGDTVESDSNSNNGDSGGDVAS